MPKSLALIISLTVGLTLAETCFAQSDWGRAPTGSLLGGGAPRQGSGPAPSKTLPQRLAGEEGGLRNALLRLDSQSGTFVSGVSLIAASVSAQVGVPTERLKRQQAASSLTYAELLVANTIATATKKTFEETLAAKKGKTWSALAAQNNVSTKLIADRAASASESIRLAQSRRLRREEQAVRDTVGTFESRTNAGTLGN